MDETPSRPPIDDNPVDDYALEGGDPVVSHEAPLAPVPPVAPAVPRPKKKKTTDEGEVETRKREKTDESATVDEVWSRGAEWGSTLVLLGIVALSFAVLCYLALSINVFLAFFLMLAGGVTLIVLSYPIFITLERPVRITPEQAVQDFFAALSHRLPHYRRMWLLLSSAGRKSRSFSSYPEFKTYWQQRLARFRSEGAGRSGPLLFEVEDFRSEKSAGKTSLDGKFNLKVSYADQKEGGPIETLRIEMGLIKGPDRMWYLNKGDLPDRL